MKRQAPGRRAELVASLNRAIREATALGAMFGDAVAAALGLNRTDFECLDLIAMRGEVTAGELATLIGVTTGAVTGIVDRLEAAGFVRRERDAIDRRKVHVRLVSAAYQRAAKHYASFGRRMDGLAESYGDRELATLIEYFNRSRDIVLDELERLRAIGKAET